jgi:hypothetical protein
MSTNVIERNRSDCKYVQIFTHRRTEQKDSVY